MSNRSEPFALLELQESSGDFRALQDKPVSEVPAVAAAATAILHGFDLAGQPLVTGLPGIVHETVVARATVPVASGHIGKAMVVVFERGDVRLPIIIGVIESPAAVAGLREQRTPESVLVEADTTRLVLKAEREIVLQCGDASITLTRAGKVIIRGTYVLSRSSGYNKIKGAAVDIN